MVIIKEKISQPVSAHNINSLNSRLQAPVSAATVGTLNHPKREQSNQSDSLPHPQQMPVYPSVPVQSASRSAPAPAVPQQRNVEAPAPVQQISIMRIPRLESPVQKGQKIKLESASGTPRRLRFGFGWNVNNNLCDLDASAFLCAAGDKVPGDDWFVFYGQPSSPDRSVSFREDPSHTDREIIQVDLTGIDPRIQKVVFVLTINEAFENYLNFNMVEDAYVRIIDEMTNQVLASFKLDDRYENITSMTIGELYLRNGEWKFNAVGNGVHQDLPGQCQIYGVNIC